MAARENRTPCGRGNPQPLSVRRLLRGYVLGPRGYNLGYIYDVAVRETRQRYPPVAGALVCLGGYDLFVPAERITDWQPEAVYLHGLPPLHTRIDRDDVVLLKAELLGRWFDAPDHPGRVRARDFLLNRSRQRWELTTIDTRRRFTRLRQLQPDKLIDWATVGHTLAGRAPTPGEQ